MCQLNMPATSRVLQVLEIKFHCSQKYAQAQKLLPNVMSSICSRFLAFAHQASMSKACDGPWRGTWHLHGHLWYLRAYAGGGALKHACCLQTLHCSNVMSDQIVQITQKQVRLLDASTRALREQWQPNSGSYINAATATPSQVSAVPACPSPHPAQSCSSALHQQGKLQSSTQSCTQQLS